MNAKEKAKKHPKTIAEVYKQKINRTGLKKHPEIAEQIKFSGETLLALSGNTYYDYGNSLSAISTTISLLEIQHKRLKVFYDKEGKSIKRAIKKLNKP